MDVRDILMAYNKFIANHGGKIPTPDTIISKKSEEVVDPLDLFDLETYPKV